MASIIAINGALCLGVVVAVVAPMVWAILTQQRDTQAIAVQRWRHARVATTRAQPRAARPQYRPVARPA
jgi:hypothetical protein